MKQLKSSKLLKTIMVAAVLSFPAVNAIPSDFEIAIAQPKLDGKLSLKDKEAAKNSHILLEPVKTSMDIYMAHEDVKLVSHGKGDHEKVVKANEFVATVSGTKVSPDTNITISNTNELVKIPEKYKRNFKINVSGIYDGKAVKVYKTPDEKSEVSSSAFIVPMRIISDDFTIYNSHYLKVKDDKGHYWYIDTNKSNWNVTTDNNTYRITGTYGNFNITDKVKNVTLNLTAPTNLTANEIAALTAGSELEGIEDAVIEIEEKYGINALFTVSVAMLESGHGKSWLARNRNNLFGICAYDSDVNAASSFSSKSDCVRYWGKLIHDEYFAYGRTNLDSINAIYASSTSWAYKVGNLMSRNASIVQ
jgi:beta-N-acetylglucosaminidase